MAKKSLSAFAKEIKVNPSTVSYYLKLGFLTKALVYKPGRKYPLVDTVKAKRLIGEYKNPLYSKKTMSGQTIATSSKAINRSKLKIEQLKAAKLKLDLEIKQGKRVSKFEVNDKAFRAAREMRDALLNIPARTAAILAAESDEKKCQKIIQKEIKPILKEFERKLMQI
jgi:hypothetical protein